MPKQKEKRVSFSAYFIGGFLIGLLISLIGDFFHNAPMVMWKETVVLSLGIAMLSGLWGDKFFNLLFKIVRYIF